MTSIDESLTSPSARPIPFPTGQIIRETISQMDQVERSEAYTPSDAESMPRQGFFSLIGRILKSNLKGLPSRLRRDAKWLAPLLLIWIGLWIIKPMTLMRMPSILSNLIHMMIFLTATYNGFLGKAVFVTILSRTIIPKIRSFRQEQSSSLRSHYAKTFTILRRLFAQDKLNTMKVVLLGAGLGLIASNLLTRNNRIDKYFVCVLAAVALFDDLAAGVGNPVVKLTAAGLRDLPLLFGQKLNVSMRSTYLSIAGFSAGLLLAFIPGMLNNSYTSPSGIYMGLFVMAVGIILHFKKPKAKSEQGAI